MTKFMKRPPVWLGLLFLALGSSLIALAFNMSTEDNWHLIVAQIGGIPLGLSAICIIDLIRHWHDWK